MAIDSVVFDLGGVLIDWNPRYVYRHLFDDEQEMERFLAEVCSPEWNGLQDAGRPWSEAVSVLVTEHPHYEREIRAYHERWLEMLGGPIEETVDVLRDLRYTERRRTDRRRTDRQPTDGRHVDPGPTDRLRLFGLSNWSSETFELARRLPEYAFLGWFDGIVISGDVRLVKPDPAIFRHLLERYDLVPARVLFVDDVPRNVEAARDLGMAGIVFESGRQLREELARHGVLDRALKSSTGERASPRSMG